MSTIVVEGGRYDGRTVTVYESDAELRAYAAEDAIPDGAVIGFPRSVYFEHYPGASAPVEGSSYGAGWASDTAYVATGNVFDHQQAVGGLKPFSLHELPDPGWSVNPLRPGVYEVRGPSGEIYLWYVWAVFLLWLAIAFYLVLDLILCSIKKFFMPEQKQLSQNVGYIASPGGWVTIDKTTGEVLEEGWGFMQYLIIGAVLVAAVIVAQLVFQKKSTILEMGESATRKTYEAGRAAYRKVRG